MDKQNKTGFLRVEFFGFRFPVLNERNHNNMADSLKKMRESFTAFSSNAKETAILLFLSQKENIGKMFSSRAIATAVNENPSLYGVSLDSTGIDTRKLARNKLFLFLDNRTSNNGFSDDLESLGFSAHSKHSVKLGKSGSQAVYGMVKIG